MTIQPIKKDWPKRNKFQPGAGFRNAAEAVVWLEEGKWCYWGTVPKHPSVVRNFSLTTITGAIRSGRLRPAIRLEGKT